MSCFTGPEIVNTGLMFHVDASNTKSYAGSGTTLSDVSGKGITVSLQNSGAGTVSGNSNYLDFAAPDVSSAVGYYLINDSRVAALTTQITLETCVYVNTIFAGFGMRPVSARTTETNSPLGFGIGSNYISYEINTTTGWVATSTASSAAGTGKWIYVTQTTDDANKQFKTYINGIQLVSVTYTGTPNTGNGLLIGRGYYGGVSNFHGRIAFVRYYSTALTASQVYQNFDALRWRFNL